MKPFLQDSQTLGAIVTGFDVATTPPRYVIGVLVRHGESYLFVDAEEVQPGENEALALARLAQRCVEDVQVGIFRQ